VLSAIRALRRRYGNIHVRFGEPISVRKFLPDGELAEGSVDIAKLAFEVMFRVGQVTPITPTALVAITLLAAKGNARTITELASLAEELDRYVTVRQLPITEPLRLENPAELGRVLNQLVQHGNASTFDGPDGRVYWLNADQWPKVAYYRNVIVHFFLPRAVAELALLAVGERGDPAADFWEEVARLRDLLKFEFFFPDKDQFRVAISSDLGADMPEWEAKLAAGETGKVFERLPLLASDWSLLPFFDAYQIVADQLADTVGPFEEKAFVPACLVRAKAYRLRGLLTSDEGISQVLYRSAISLASNRDLVDAADPAARRQFSDDLRLVRSRAAQVSKLRR
jgi:glycerol-3-phosphate O-acyltransferase